MGLMTLRLRKLLRVQPATRYPADPRAVFVLGLAVISGLPLLIAHIAPNSVEQLMPLWGVILWGWALVVGCLLSLAAMARQTTNAIIVEQVGSVIVGVGTLIYGACVLMTAGASGALASAITVGFGLSCFYRWLQLQELLHNGQKVVDSVRNGEDVTFVPESFQ